MNRYIKTIQDFVKDNTQVDFIYSREKEKEIIQILNTMDMNPTERDIIIASYTLFYTGIDYHLLLKDKHKDNAYYVLVGDYISSYITELLHKNKMYDILDIFISNTKRIVLSCITGKCDDQLKQDLLNYFQKVN